MLFCCFNYNLNEDLIVVNELKQQTLKINVAHSNFITCMVDIMYYNT